MTNNDELIIIRQLPIIEEQLKEIKAEIETKVKNALSLECNEETVKQVKKLRADLNKDKEALEERRKAVKKAILAPYEAFENVYKDCTVNIFAPADKALKERIDSFENNLKSKKRKEVEEYFGEYAQSKGIEFVKFEQALINVNLTVSLKRLKEQAKAFVDKVHSDLELIKTQENSTEILAEYKYTLDVNEAIIAVNERNKRMAAAKKLLTEFENEKRARAENEKNINKIISENESLTAPIIKEAVKTYEVNFRIRTKNLDDIKALKNLLIEREIEYEQY